MINNKKISFLVSFITLAMVFVGCDGSKDNKTLAKVDGIKITNHMLQHEIDLVEQDYQEYANTYYGKKQILDSMIVDILLKDEIEKNKIVTSSDFKKTRDTYLKQQQNQLKEFEEELSLKLLFAKLKEEETLEVTQEEIKAYHKKYPYEYTIKIILVDDVNLAKDIMSSITNIKTKSNFARLVKQYSIDKKSKNNKGLMESFIPGEFIPIVEDAVANMNNGKTQGFFATSNGYYIISKEGGKRISYDNAKYRIYTILKNKKADEYVNNLKNNAKIEVYYEKE